MNSGEDELDEIISALAQWCKENDRKKKAPRDAQSDVSINDGGRKGGGGQQRRYKKAEWLPCSMFKTERWPPWSMFNEGV